MEISSCFIDRFFAVMTVDIIRTGRPSAQIKLFYQCENLMVGLVNEGLTTLTGGGPSFSQGMPHPDRDRRSDWEASKILQLVIVPSGTI